MYEIQFTEGMKTLSNRNNSGMAVGSYLVEGEDRGCLYSPSIDPSVLLTSMTL